ncbi:TfoX/Sxy family protein [Arcanobacterium phocae]|nr:TfoX/Sxy family protein [Arcanobacterium phocae]
MLNSKELSEYIMDQLSDLGAIRSIPMMGGYIFYYKERIFGGIYSKGFMVKITEASKKYMPDSEPEPPYTRAKPMLPVTILDDRKTLQKMIEEMHPEFPERKVKSTGDRFCFSQANLMFI